MRIQSLKIEGLKIILKIQTQKLTKFHNQLDQTIEMPHPSHKCLLLFLFCTSFLHFYGVPIFFLCDDTIIYEMQQHLALCVYKHHLFLLSLHFFV
jgi:hypothetical protein